MAVVTLLALTALSATAAEPLAFPSAPDPGAWPTGLVVVELGFTGDTMVHGNQLAAAEQPDGTWRMDGLFDAVAPWSSGVDWMAANLETTIAGEDLGGYTGFPRFNSPPVILDALRGAGVDLLQTTNNHCLDRGERGLVRTLEAVDAHGFLRAGTFASQEEREQRPFAMVTLDGGLRVAYLAYTYDTEAGFFHKAWWRLAYVAQDGFAHDIGLARAAGADLVVVGVHWGREYQHAPHRHEVELAHRLARLGADVVWGTHPHVLQPAEVVTVEGDHGPRDALILYSLGNLVSNQREPERDGGVIVRLTALRHRDSDRTWLADVRFTPVWVDDDLAAGELHYRVLPTVTTPALCGDPDVSAADCARLLGFRAHAAGIFPAEQISDALGPPAWARILDIGASTRRFRYFE